MNAGVTPSSHTRISRWFTLATIVVILVVLLIVSAGCGSQRNAQSSVRMRITLTTWNDNHEQHGTFTLGCQPTSGTLPLAARVCADIARHPAAMLDPAKRRWTCSGSPFMPQLTVNATRGGAHTSFEGSPGCDWPGGTALTIYWAASRNDAKTLALVEPRLRCDDDHVLLAMPTPRASAVACVHGLWTPRSERLIRTAEHTPALAGLQAGKLFPADIGARSCPIPAGGPARSALYGTCAVTLSHAWSRPTVTFVEDWPRPRGGIFRHRWQIRVSGGQATVVSQTGPAPPQRLD